MIAIDTIIFWDILGSVLNGFYRFFKINFDIHYFI